jgi:tetratricopeptide (TPR) repeat protein
VEAAPADHQPLLALVLPSHGLCLAAAGDFGEALRITEEAVELCRRLALTAPRAYEPQLARALYAYAKTRLLAGVESAQAKECIAEAIMRYRSLAHDEPGLVGFRLDDVVETHNRLFTGCGGGEEEPS